MSIIYGPYEPPPPTEPPPHGFEPVGPDPARGAADEPTGPFAVGVLLAVCGLGATLIGLFALPIQRYAPGGGSDVGYSDIRRLVAGAGYESTLPGVASPLARLWWSTGLVAAVAVLTLLTGAICVADSRRVRRPMALTSAVLTVILGSAHAWAMAHTADYASVIVDDAPTRTLFHASGLGPWVGFIGLGANAIGAALIALWRPQPAPR